MTIYYKIYHYSKTNNLPSIDPDYYGTGAARGAECRHGKTGLNKTYFYTIDKPESVLLTNATRYEIYLPSDWKDLIYDIGDDSREFSQACRKK